MVVFNEALVGIIRQYVKKGAKLYVEGALKTRRWTDGNGVERYITEVVLSGFTGNITMLGGVKDNEPRAAEPGQQHHASQQPGMYDDEPDAASGFIDDEIPF